MKIELKITRFFIILLILVVLIVFASIASASAIDRKCINIENPIDDYLDSLKKYTKEHHFRQVDNFKSFEVKYKGRIILSHDDKDIASISPGGYFTVQKSSFGNKRKIRIYSNGNKLVKEYFEGKTKKDFNKDGKDWLSEILPRLIYQTGIGAEDRMKHLMRNSFAAILDELDKVYSFGRKGQTKVGITYQYESNFGSNAYNLYMKIIADKYKMSKNELYNYLKYVKRIRSNSTKGNILRVLLEKYSFNEDLMNVFLITTSSLDYNTERGATLRAFMKKYKITEQNYMQFFNVVDKMNNYQEKSNIHKPLLKEQKMADKVMFRFFESVGKLTSNSEKGAILYELLPMLQGNNEYTKAFIRVLNNLHSSYSNLKEDLMMEMVDAQRDSRLKENKTILMGLLRNAKGYSTNTKKFILLRKINYVFINDDDFIYEYFNVIRGMDNELLRYNLLLHLLWNNKIDNKIAMPLFDAVTKLCREGRSHAAGAILREYIKQWPAEKMVREGFFDALESVEHSCTVQEILLLLAEKGDLRPGDLFNIIKLTKKMETDIQVATVLCEVKPMLSDSETKYIFNSQAEKMDAEYDFNKVVDR